MREQLEAIEDFRIEAEQHNFTAAQFAKKLMGQIVFLYFLQKKGWLGVGAWPNTLTEKEYKNAFYARGAKSRELIPVVYRPVGDGTYRISSAGLNSISDADEEVLANCVKGKPWGSGPHDFMRRLFNLAIQRNVNFYNDLLEPLFYDALNRNRGEQGYCPALHCRIPFLSGGLFEPIDGYDWEHNDFSIPNEVFSNAAEKGRDADGILDIFDRYNFTMSEDEPMEREVAIDPEMLGKVFENLLEINDRKSKGAFYTPREIVHYMCQESLINYLTNTLNISEEAIRDFILYGDFMKDEDTVKEKRQGNGGMYISEELYKINPDGTVAVNRLLDMDIALKNVRVADPAVGSGAFPLGMLNEIVRARQNISAYLAITMKPYDVRMMYQMDRSPHTLKYETIRNCIFACDIEPSAVDITQLRLWLALVIDDEINPNAQSPLDGHRNPLPLPNLECNILCGNSLVDEFEEIQLINQSDLLGNVIENSQMNLNQGRFESIVVSLIDKQNELFRCDDTEKKRQLKEEIDALRDMIILSQLEGYSPDVIERYNETKQVASKPYVLWQLDFARVFKEKGGFDIVIGNPPYVRVQNLSHELIDYYKKRWSTAYKRIDMSVLFIERGLTLLHKKGNLTYISSNQFLSTEYGRMLREYLITNKAVDRIVDFGDLKIFANAMTYVSIFFLSKIGSPSFGYRRIKELPFVSPDDFETISLSSVGSDPWSLGKSDVVCVLDKIKDAAKKELASYAIPFSGLVTGKDETLMFDIDETVPFEDSITLPVIRAQGCDRYADAYPSKKVLYPYQLCGGKTEILSLDTIKSEYPKTYSYIEDHAEELKERKDSRKKFGDRAGWYGLVRFGQMEMYNKPKIVTPGEVKHNKFCIDSTNSGFTCARVFGIMPSDETIDIRYMLAILNSKVVEFFMHHTAPLKAGGYYSYSSSALEKIPFVVADDQSELIALVDDVMKLKQNSGETQPIEEEIDKIVYELYGMNPNDIKIIEDDLSNT